MKDELSTESSQRNVWFRSLSTIDPKVFRLLTASAGVVGIFAVLNVLPFVNPFLVPPYPTQYTGSWNFFALVEHPVWTWAVLLAACVASIALIRGIRTRCSALVLLLFMSGVISSARPLTNSGSSVFCLLMLFLALMPEVRDDGSRRGIAVLGLRLQVFLIYFCGTFFKLADPAWQQGFPLAGTLIGFSWSSHLGVWLSQVFPVSVLNVFGQMVLGVEAIAPLAFLLGFRFALVRRAGVVLLSLMHVGTAMLMTLEVFPWVMVTVLMVFWDQGMVEACSSLAKKVRKWGAGRIREVVSGVVVIFILFTASVQVFLPAMGIKFPWANQSVSVLNRQFRFDQHWGMFTNTSFDLNEEVRKKPDKTYKTTRLFVKTEDDKLWDPFTGRVTSLRQGLIEGASHPDSSRKAISYFYKSKGGWQKRGLRTMSKWAIDRAVDAGISPKFVMIYRYSIPVNFRGSLSFDEIEGVRAKLWYRFVLTDGEISSEELISPRSIRSVSIDLSEGRIL